MAGEWHPDRHELHGITVVVDTHGDAVYLGRCDDIAGGRVILLDADMHKEGDGGRSKSEYVQRAAQLGFWKKFDRLEVPETEVASIRRLGEL